MPTPFRLYSTASREISVFTPLNPGEIKLYVCGVTPYDHSHLGHGRIAVVYDAFVRFLRAVGWKVTYARNFTDVDDKIINRAAEQGITPQDIAQTYIDSFKADTAKLNTLAPTYEPRVTTHMPYIIDLIEKLHERGYAYVGKSGDVLFDTVKMADYGKLSRKPLDELVAGARVEVNPDKKTPTDFVLWKRAKPGEPAWPSPWGQGRPGWHIECSAMSAHHLGDTFDIHGGGADLMFPHHENEVAQSECGHGKPFVHYWMHVAFLQINSTKMSKSLGNFTYLRDVLNTVSGEALRLYFLQTHYRNPIDFTPEAVAAAETALRNLYATLHRAGAAHAQPESPRLKDFELALADDFNTPQALSVMFTTAADLNKALDGGDEMTAAGLAAALHTMGTVLGLFSYPVVDFLQGRAGTLQKVDPARVDALVAARTQARKDHDFTKADALRDELVALGVVLEDTPQGTSWRLG